MQLNLAFNKNFAGPLACRDTGMVRVHVAACLIVPVGRLCIKEPLQAHHGRGRWQVTTCINDSLPSLIEDLPIIPFRCSTYGMHTPLQCALIWTPRPLSCRRGARRTIDSSSGTSPQTSLASRMRSVGAGPGAWHRYIWCICV